MQETIGFIGLGIMGLPMAKNLLGAGYSLTVYDKLPRQMEECVKLGAQGADSPAAVAVKSTLVFTMLPDGPDVKEVVAGPRGILEDAVADLIIVDTSSINPMVAIEIGKRCKEKGVHYLDAPVSGGQPGAVEGTLAIMVGGDAEAFQRAQKALEVVGASVTLTGDVGAGNVTKLANQIMVAVNIAGVSEAMVLATKAGLDPEVVFNAVKGGLAGSNVLNTKAPSMIQRNFKPGFRIELHQKDLRNTLAMAESLQLPLPLTSYCQQMLLGLLNDGKGGDDHGGMVQYLEKVANIRVGQGRPSA